MFNSFIFIENDQEFFIYIFMIEALVFLLLVSSKFTFWYDKIKKYFTHMCIWIHSL